MSFNKTSIDWPFKPLHTWNPVIGCARNCSHDGRPWCYARKIATRFHMTPDFSKPVFFPERLAQPPPKKVKHVFVGSMSDIEYWKPEWTREIIDYCGRHDEREFYFLSKNPRSYDDFLWPKNCHIGLTMTLAETEEEQCRKMQAFGIGPRTFLSLEPLLGTLKVKCAGMFEPIIVGAMSGPGAVPVKQEWIDSITQYNIPVYWKRPLGNGAGQKGA